MIGVVTCMDLVDRIIEAAKAKGMSLSAFEKQMGVSTGTIMRFRRSTPGVDKVVRIAEMLDVRAGWLVDGYMDDANLQLDEREINLIKHFRALDLDGKASVEHAAVEEHRRVRLEGDSEATAN